MSDTGMRLKIGGFVGATLVVLAGLVIFFGRAPELFTSKTRYSILFPEAPGIAPGTPIRKSGVRIGEVTSVDLDEETSQVKVQILVDRKFHPRQTEAAIITRGLLNGDTAIDFIPKIGEGGKPLPRGEEWPPGSEIQGVAPITPRTLLTPASEVLMNAQSSLDRIVRAFEKLEKLQTLQPKVERAIDEATDTLKAIREFIPKLEKTNERIQNFIGAEAREKPTIVPAGFLMAQPADGSSLRDLIRDIQDLARTARPAVEDIRGMVRRLEPELTGAVKSGRLTFDSINDILSPENRKQFTELLKNTNGVAVYVVKISGALTTLLEAAEKTLKNIDTQVTEAGGVVGDVRAITKPLATKSEALVTSVTDSAEQLNRALTEVRALLQTFGRGNGSIQKLLTDPTVYQNLDEAAGSLARVLAKAERISKDLEVFSDKIARRPELIGAGGIVRPSSGLKDIPGPALPAYKPEWPPALPARPAHGQHWLPPQSVQGYPPR